jgi:hypothetical protein
MQHLPRPDPRRDAATTTFSMTAYGDAERVRIQDHIEVCRRDDFPLEFEHEQMQPRRAQLLLATCSTVHANGDVSLG